MLREYVDDIKAKSSCKFCAEKEPCCLEYHHLDPTTKDIDPANMVSQGWAKVRIDAELAKCICVCSNCHKKVHKGLLEC